jgi:hypothetical protein
MLNKIINWILKNIGGVEMIDLYCAFIIAGRRTFTQVPIRFQEAVRADLLALGLDENGQILS